MNGPLPPVSSSDRSAEGPGGRSAVLGVVGVLVGDDDAVDPLLEHPATATRALTTTTITRLRRTCSSPIPTPSAMDRRSV
jgi:hypothetical protein